MEKSKSDIRKEKLFIRRSLTDDECHHLSLIILDNLKKLYGFNSNDTYLLYSSYNHEVDTGIIFEYLSNLKKNVYFPKVEGEYMEFYRIENLDELSKGCMGIMEPKSDNYDIYRDITNFVVLLPLSAFDRSGNRIGYGGGYYDKYLENHKNCLKIGLAYSFQESDEIVPEKTDIKLDYIITEKEIIEVKNG